MILLIISNILGKVSIIYLLNIVYSGSFWLENNLPEIIWVKIFDIISKFSFAIWDKTPFVNIPLKYGLEIRGIIILPIKKFDKNINVLYSVFCIFSFEYFSFNKIKNILFMDLIT